MVSLSPSSDSNAQDEHRSHVSHHTARLLVPHFRGFTNTMTAPRDSSGSPDSEITSMFHRWLTANEKIENRCKDSVQSFRDDDLANFTVDDTPGSPGMGPLSHALEREHDGLGEGVDSGDVNDQVPHLRLLLVQGLLSMWTGVLDYVLYLPIGIGLFQVQNQQLLIVSEGQNQLVHLDEPYRSLAGERARGIGTFSYWMFRFKLWWTSTSKQGK